MNLELMQIAVACVITGAFSALLTVAAIKVDLRNLRESVKRIDAVATKGHETSIANHVRITHLEKRGHS